MQLIEELQKAYTEQCRSVILKKLPICSQSFQQNQSNSILQSLVHHAKSLVAYNDENAREMALCEIDLESIYAAVDSQSETDTLGYTDLLARQVLHFFKHSFFTWVNSPPCETCGNTQLQNCGVSPPKSAEEISGKAHVVELYRCNDCRRVTRFPRYNDMCTLLKWRKGRCGEWNNCFILLLKALGIETRLCWNVEDHVWCEYYSEKMKRWVHLDSCEEAFDNPMLYCKGWNKKMSHVFAIGEDYIINVTEKYVDSEHRLESGERIPENAVRFLNYSRWQFLKGETLYPILVRYSRELKRTEVHGCRNLEARQSGCKDWTKMRGEDGFS